LDQDCYAVDGVDKSDRANPEEKASENQENGSNSASNINTAIYEII